MIYKEYVDAGFSGATDDRPAFQEMLRDARNGRFSGVAVTKLDRFMPDARLMLNAIETLDRDKIAFITIKEGVDTSDKSTGRVILTIFPAIAEWERDRIRERTQEGRYATAKKGGLLGGFAPFGYRYVSRSDSHLAHLEIDPSQAEVVRDIFSLVIGAGFLRI